MNKTEKIAIILSISFSIIVIMTFIHFMINDTQTVPETPAIQIVPNETINITDSDHFVVNGNYQEVKPVTVVKQPVKTVVKTEVVYKEPEEPPHPKPTVPDYWYKDD